MQTEPAWFPDPTLCEYGVLGKRNLGNPTVVGSGTPNGPASVASTRPVLTAGVEIEPPQTASDIATPYDCQRRALN